MPKVDESFIKTVTRQMRNSAPEDFEQLDADIPTDADDGETVAILLTGYAKDGKLTNIEATDFDVVEEKPGLKNMLSDEEDGDKEEDNA